LPSDILAKFEPELVEFASQASSDRVKEWMLNAEREPPYVKSYNVWGAKHDVDRLVTSDGWKRLREWGASNGFVSVYSFALLTMSLTSGTGLSPWDMRLNTVTIRGLCSTQSWSRFEHGSIGSFADGSQGTTSSRQCRPSRLAHCR
jgi:hypothetical protein